MQGSTEASTSQAVADAASDKINDILPAFNRWRHAVARLTGLSFTQTTDVAAEETHLDAEKLRKQQKKECLRCQQWRDTVISESGRIVNTRHANLMYDIGRPDRPIHAPARQFFAETRLSRGARVIPPT